MKLVTLTGWWDVNRLSNDAWEIGQLGWSRLQQSTWRMLRALSSNFGAPDVGEKFLQHLLPPGGLILSVGAGFEWKSGRKEIHLIFRITHPKAADSGIFAAYVRSPEFGSQMTAVQISRDPVWGPGDLLGYWTRLDAGRDQGAELCCPD